MRKSLAAALLAGIVLAATGCARRDVHRTLRGTAHNPEGWPKIIAVYQPWFGDPKHIDVGYSSHDTVVIKKQIEQAKSLGIFAFAVDWYGPRLPFLDKAYALMQKAAAENNFQVAIMYDETEEDTGHATDDAILAFEKAYHAYIGPGAPGREAYMTYNGRPVIFIFPKRGRTDWKIVRNYVDSWEVPPLLIYKDEKSEYADRFDGYYAWVHPDKNWAPDGGDWGENYLANFYARMQREHPGKLVVGGAWPGFDDRKAAWSLNRIMDSRCGRTFEETLRMFRRFHSDSNPLPFLMIATWNDYEEGTAIERGLAKPEFERSLAKCDSKPGSRSAAGGN
ncbi:MAG TPA: hypothetical protein VGQ71_11510 [Terriglobales bacterium]|jgi:hypothetical protein|nr:hypothetical protein [Terriglobales bacterium]